MTSCPLQLLLRTPDVPHSRLLNRSNHPELKIEQKRVQNKNASRRSKEKKICKEKMLMDTVRSLKMNLEKYRRINQEFEGKLYRSYYQDLYPNVNERSPYGNPDNFFVTVNHWKIRLEMANPIEKQLGYKKLLRKIKNLKKVILSHEKPQEMSRGTFGSRRTRAKKDLPVAELELEHWKLEFDKKMEVKIGSVLTMTAKILNDYLRVINGVSLVDEKILY